MGKIIFIACAIIFCFGILRSKGTSRLIWFFTGIFFFQERIILLESPIVVNFHRFLIYVLLLGELFDLKSFIKTLRGFPLVNSLMAVLLGLLLVGVFDVRNNAALNIYRILDDYIQSFFIIFLCYVNFERDRDYKKLIKFFIISSTVLCTYGFYIFITESNPYDNLVTELYGLPSYFDQYALVDYEERFRVNSFVAHPIYYGYLLGVILLLLFSNFVFEGNYKITVSLASMSMVFLNLILSNSRTPLATTVFGLALFVLIAMNSKMKLQVLICGVFTSFLVYNVPLIQEKVDNTIDIFLTGGSKVTGSSIDMRLEQLYASYEVFEKNPIVGNGFKYITEDLGYSNTEENEAASEFVGFESYIYIVLIEQGAVGVAVNLIFFISLISYFFRMVCISKPLAGMGVAVISMFLLYSISTGTLGAWAITMGIAGVLISMLNKTNEVIKSENACLEAIVKSSAEYNDQGTTL